MVGFEHAHGAACFRCDLIRHTAKEKSLESRTAVGTDHDEISRPFSRFGKNSPGRRISEPGMIDRPGWKQGMEMLGASRSGFACPRKRLQRVLRPCDLRRGDIAGKSWIVQNEIGRQPDLGYRQHLGLTFFGKPSAHHVPHRRFRTWRTIKRYEYSFHSAAPVTFTHW